LTPKQKREVLFRHSRPNVRKLEIKNAEGFTKDAAILWSAYRAGSFNLPPDLPQDRFAEATALMCRQFDEMYIIDDASRGYKTGWGPVATVGIKKDGYLMALSAQPFKWATPKNVLRCAVSFLWFKSRATDAGVLMGAFTSKDLPTHVRRYFNDDDLKPFIYVGRTGPTEWMYALRGRLSGGKGISYKRSD
jgi:hypothetical protein